jgi:hypothetical protein
MKVGAQLKLLPSGCGCGYSALETHSARPGGGTVNEEITVVQPNSLSVTCGAG